MPQVAGEVRRLAAEASVPVTTVTSRLDVTADWVVGGDPREPDLRTVLSKPTRARLREHAVIVEAILRRIITAGIVTRQFPEQDVDVTVALVNACLSGQHLPEEQEARNRAVAATEAFVLRAVGVPPRIARAGR